MSQREMNQVRVEGRDAPLVDRLRDPLHRALRDRGTVYSVAVERIGMIGEVLVSITGPRGRLPLLLRGEEELASAHVFRVVSDTVVRFGL